MEFIIIISFELAFACFVKRGASNRSVITAASAVDGMIYQPWISLTQVLSGSPAKSYLTNMEHWITLYLIFSA